MTAPVLSVRDVTKTFGAIRAVQGVSFDVHPGEILGLIGPNGSGKSTLFNCILGQYPPSSGEVFINGHSVAGKRAFHQVLAWSTISRYDRAAFDALLGGFDEMPDDGSDRAAAVAPGPIQIEPVSKYLIH